VTGLFRIERLPRLVKERTLRLVCLSRSACTKSINDVHATNWGSSFGYFSTDLLCRRTFSLNEHFEVLTLKIKLVIIALVKHLSCDGATVPIGEEYRSQLWDKAKFTFAHLYEHNLNDYDWFFEADDDTYIIMEHLREYVISEDSNLPWFLGRRFKFSTWKEQLFDWRTRLA
jgi:hypothetical protein